MTKKPTIIITGATGFIGGKLVDHFSQKGWRVLALSRTPAASKTPVEHKHYDLMTDLNTLDLGTVDYMIHTAYSPKQAAGKDENIEGAKRLLSYAREHKVKRCIFLSSMSALSDARSYYGKQKYAIEQLFDSKKETVLRLGLVIGPGGLVERLASFMKTKRLVPLIDSGVQPLQIVGIHDVVSIIEKVLEGNHSGTYTIASTEVYSYKTFYQALGKQLGVKPLFVSVPFWLPLYGIRTVRFLHLPLKITEDNLQGLKMLRSEITAPGLRKLGVKIEPLKKALARAGL